MPLREWQDKFQQCVLQPDLADEKLYQLFQTGAVDKKTQFDIYSNAYVMRLAEALRTNYPAVHQLLGDDDFTVMAKQYLDEYPSQHPSIRWFGNALRDFFKVNQPYSGVPVFAELAEFEWALRHSIDAADADRATVEMLQAIAADSWGELRFLLHPSVTLMSLQWNTPQIWQALVEDTEIPERVQQPMDWLVYRQVDLVTAWRSVTDIELSALRCIQQGGNFSDICEALNDAAQAASVLRLWVEQGLVCLCLEK